MINILMPISPVATAEAPPVSDSPSVPDSSPAPVVTDTEVSKPTPTFIEPKVIQREVSSELREVVIAGIEDPKGTVHSDETVPIINKFKLQEFFDVFQPTYKETEILDNLYQYFNKKGFDSMNEVFMEIMGIERKLGHVPMGQNRLNYLWNYLKIFSQIESDNLRNERN